MPGMRSGRRSSIPDPARSKARGSRRARVTEHYSGHDPETGCGWMAAGAALIVVALVAIAIIRAVA